MDSGGANQGTLANAVWISPSRSLTQGPAVVPSGQFQAPTVSAVISLTATGTTVVINYSGTPGVLLSVGEVVNAGLVGVSMSSQIEIVVDSIQQNILLYQAGTTWDVGVTSTASWSRGSGQTSPDTVVWQLGLQFSNSLIVRYNVTATNLTQGNCKVGLLVSHP
jgi:hypothetical protein